MATNSSPARQANNAAYLAPFAPSFGIRSHGTATPTHGSATQTLTPAGDSRSLTPEPLVLRLRGSHEPSPEAEEAENSPSSANNRRRRIQWAEDVVDNEGLGRKKSKVCCIYHKDREFGESSSDESSSSSSSNSDSDGGGSSSGADDGSARPVGGNKKNNRKKRGRRGRKHNHNHDHDHGDDCGHDHSEGGRRPSPNAYERMPKYNVRPLNGNLPGQASTQGGTGG